jgi:hypothetical protein
MIVIPMAGLSSRFIAAGYTQPKFMLPLWGGSVFDQAVSSFDFYFDTVPFLFIARRSEGTESFVRRSCSNLGIRDAQVQMLDTPTAGQAETVELGLREEGIADDVPLTIFNIDTFRPGFRFPERNALEPSGGYLEVFKGKGSNWSYVRTLESDPLRVVETAEKRPISDLCCTGLYHFAAAGDFFSALASEREKPSAPELYVAPLYNHLIRSGITVHYNLVSVSDIMFCGVPAEYEALLSSKSTKPEHRLR